MNILDHQLSAPRRVTLTSAGWPPRAVSRMVMHGGDPDAAVRPGGLLIKCHSVRALRSRAAVAAERATLRRLECVPRDPGGDPNDPIVLPRQIAAAVRGHLDIPSATAEGVDR